VYNISESLFWDPELHERQNDLLLTKQEIRDEEDHLSFLQHLDTLREKKDCFIQLESDILLDKSILEKEIEGITHDLTKLRNLFLTKVEIKGSLHCTKSDVSLLLTKYERCFSSYSLFNDILDLIHKTLISVDSTEKFANLCGKVTVAGPFHSSGFVSTSGTLQNLVEDLAKYDATKMTIESQLSLARCKNVDLSLTLGSSIDNLTCNSITNAFLESGEISIPMVQISNPKEENLKGTFPVK